MISDEVWDRIDHRAGVTTPSRAWRSRAWYTAIAVVILLLPGAAATGLAVPRLTLDPSGPKVWTVYDDVGRPRQLTLQLGHRIVNDGWLPVTVSGAALRGDGLRLTDVREEGGRAFPLTVRPGGLIKLTLLVTVTDCERVIAAPPEPLIRVDRWWGQQTTSPEQEYESDWEFPLRTACDR